jgi:hypothetical protein
MSLAALDAWTLAAARDGLQHGSGPFWDASQLCGQPLFGVWGQPWSSPVSLLLLGGGRAPLVALAATGSVLLWAQGPRQRWTLLAAGLGLACFASMPNGFVAALALAPWALLAFWRAPLAASVALLALFLSTLSPLLSALVLGLSYFERRDPRAWAQRVGWALLLSAPAWLPLWSQSTAVLERGRTWRLAAPSEWLAALAWSASVSLFAAPKRAGALAGVAAAALTAMLALSLPPAFSVAPPVAPPRFNQVVSRYLDSQGSPEALAQAVAGYQAQASVVGSLDGRGSLPGLQRWRRLVALGVREADLLSLSNVGWFAGLEDGKGGRWTLPVGLALVDGALLEGDQEARWTGIGLFQRPLKVSGVPVKPASASTWRFLSPQSQIVGRVQVALPAGHQGGWLFFSQSYDAGWKAWVQAGDGRWLPTPVAKTEGAFLASPVETSAQAVLFQYEPPYFALALWLSLASLLVLVWKERALLAYGR